MLIEAPEIRLFFENAISEQLFLGSNRMLHYSIGAEKVFKYNLFESFGYLNVEIFHTNGQQIEIILDGKNVHSRNFGNIDFFRLALDQDLGFHRISIIASPSYILTLDIEIEHHYKPSGHNSSDGIPKWTISQFKQELTKYKELFTNSYQHQFLPDITNKSIKKGDDDSGQLLLQIIGRLEVALSTVNIEEACIDFHEHLFGEYDREAILSELKQNCQYLSPNTMGSIHLGKDKYSTTLSYRQLRNSKIVDLSEVVAVLEICASIIKKTSAPPISSLLISTLIDEILFRFPYKNRYSETFGSILNREMRSPFGTTIQQYLITILMIVNSFACRDPIDHGLYWLIQSIQDRDVFQISVFASCAKALGFSNEDLKSSNGLLNIPGLQIANTNTSAGRDYFKNHINSWRSTSLQPSEYRPDVFINFNGKPVIIDAKFRMPNSVWLIGEPNGIKDVQAYMNDFDVDAAIIIVPKILNQSSINADGHAEIKGNSKHIFIIEMIDSDDIFAQERIKTAIRRTALLQHSQLL